MGFFSTIVVGLIAGFLAHAIMKTRANIIVDLILGIIGGVVGGWLTTVLFKVDLMSGINPTSIIVALVGSIIVILIYRLIRREL